ncbi:MAG: BREX system P-loop protein BrxC, partial [Bacteroidetes bacterium]|nr:BREX system P-loop protein BrxC [Bacteroidota bacterium]
MLIKDILTIDLSEDIKNVIDLEDISEAEILSEIENYIITDGLAREYMDFVSKFTANTLETGVWLSGFYGSGKSYFGKMLGYMLSNRIISGTPARDRILQRFTGINDESLIRNTISRLNSEQCIVISLDIAKQDTSKGLAFTLFRNFLRSIELPENEHGILLYKLMLKEGFTDINDFIFQKLNKKWADAKRHLTEYSKEAKSIYLTGGNDENDYHNILVTIRRDMDHFDASRLRDELKTYFTIEKDIKLVFIFDESSEAINQKKFSLLDLEGISEALSDSELLRKTWTIAIAQEKLDDVISNSSVNRAQLTKVTDRFKTKIHLEATEVDVIIQSRLLKKSKAGLQELEAHYNWNTGKIADHAALIATGITKTDTLDSWLTYYPFYKYQFDLLQNFLFGTKGYVSTKVAARGMIITTYDILKQHLQHNKLFEIATGWQITREAQPQPPVRLVNRYSNAENILKESGSEISGRKLLETIHFLAEAEVVPTTLPNITKSFVSDADEYHQVNPKIKKALEILEEARILLPSNGTYRITSDIEERLLDEMNGFTVQQYQKKRQMVNAYKTNNIIKTLARTTDNNLQYDFYITTDNDDELTNPGKKFLKIKLKSVYNISDNRGADIDQLKIAHQNDKDLIYLVPDNSSFKEIDKLIDEVERITYLEQKYDNPQSDEAPIMRAFSAAKSDKLKRITDLVEQSLQKGTAIYLFNTFQLDKDSWQATLQKRQKNLISNVYHKRLSAQLSDELAARVIKETNASRLQSYFTGPEFLFFDAQGNFIGENLKVAEEILFKIRNTYVDGAALEKDLELPPTGYTFGTVISTVATLMRAGKIMAKHNGAEKFSWQDPGVTEIFSAAREFRRASFKLMSKSLTAQNKQIIAQFLLDTDVVKYTDRRINYNSNEFELINALRDLARLMCDKVDNMRKQNKDFDVLFPELESKKDNLAGFTGAVSEANYIERAENFLENKETFLQSLKTIEKVEKFIGNNLPKLLQWRQFVNDVNDELRKAAKANDTIARLTKEFNDLYEHEVVKNFAGIQQTAQKIKDEYHRIFQEAATDMAQKYVQLQKDAEALIKEIHSLPAGLNKEGLDKAGDILKYAEQRKQAAVILDFDVHEKQTRFTYSEVLSFTELYNTKSTELSIISAGLIRTAPVGDKPGVPEKPLKKKHSTRLPSQFMKVVAYKKWLQQELQKLAG